MKKTKNKKLSRDNFNTMVNIIACEFHNIMSSLPETEPFTVNDTEEWIGSTIEAFLADDGIIVKRKK